jgi:hypothetical protein
MKCDRTDCGADATCAVGVALYPHASLMAYYRTTRPLTRMVLGLVTCDAHFAELTVAELLPPATLDPLVNTVEHHTLTKVNRAATALVKVGLADPDYLTLKRQRAQRDAAKA